MFWVKLADLTIRIDNKYGFIENKCRDYITDSRNEDFSVSVTESEIEAEKTPGFGADYLEMLAVYRKIAEKIIEYDGMLIHGVLMGYEGRGIMLCAKSGVGKSTHAMLWKRRFGDKCEIINGDKPLIRVRDGKIIAYGTPWSGKEGIEMNKSVCLTDICFLERAEKNSAEPLPKDNIMPFFNQIYLPKYSGEKMLKSMDILDKLIECTRQWKIRCNTDISAAETVRDALTE